MAGNFQLTDYNFYSSAKEHELVKSISDALWGIIEEDKKHAKPLFIKVSDGFIKKIARKAVVERKKTFLIGVSGESASGKTTFVDNTVKTCLNDKKEGIYTIVRCDNYFKDVSKELKEAGSYEALFKSGFSFETPAALDLDLMREQLLTLKSGKSVIAPRHDFVTCVVTQGEEKKPAKVILSEGLYALDDIFHDIIDIKVYVSAPFDIIKERWYKRAASRGKTGKAADLQFADVNKTAQNYIRPHMEISDVVINGLVDIDYIEVITDRIFNTVKSLL